MSVFHCKAASGPCCFTSEVRTVQFSPQNLSGWRGRALLCSARAGVGEGRAGAGIWIFRSCWGIADTSGLAGAAWVSWQRWLSEIGSSPGGHGRRLVGWLGSLIVTTALQKGLWETHVSPDLSADFFFFFFFSPNKRHYFRTGNLHFSALPPPLSLSLSHTRTFLLPWGISAAQSSEKQIPASFLREQGEGDARSVLGCGVKFPALWKGTRKQRFLAASQSL